MASLEHEQSNHNRTAAMGIAGILIISAATACTATIKHNSEQTPQPTLASTASPSVKQSQPVAPTAEQCALEQPVSFLAGQALMIGLQAEAMPAQTSIFKRYHVGGAVLMTSPANPYDGSIQRFKNEGGSIHDPLLISTDEEGGLVQRFLSLGSFPSAQFVAQEYTPAQAQQMIYDHGLKLKNVGIDMVLGPLADVAPTNAESTLGNRVFSDNPQTVARYDLAYIRGWQSAGILPTLKHYPGMGAASGNTDYEVATTPPLSALRQRDFVPYKMLANSGAAVMVGNPNVPGWFVGPASLNALPERYLRNVLGFKNNLVVTDDLAAKAITNVASIQDAIVGALAAGYDMPLVVEPSAEPIASSAFIGSLETAIEQAVRDGRINKEHLATTLVRKLKVQHIGACSLVANNAS